MDEETDHEALRKSADEKLMLYQEALAGNIYAIYKSMLMRGLIKKEYFDEWEELARDES